MKLTKKEIIEETVEYYKNNPRSVEGSTCRYLGEDGELCAFARVVKPEFRRHLREEGSVITQKEPILEFNSFMKRKAINKNILLDKYNDILDIHFWNDIQKLHDLEQFWDRNKLTGLGRVEVEKLIKRYK